MISGSTVLEEWQLACQAEHEAWVNVEGRLPGAPDHDPEAWKNWQECLRSATEAMQRLIDDQ
jgi:hypothetical protein